MSNQRFAGRTRLQFQRGLSLVELMVALTIGLFLMGAVGIIYVNTATTSRGSTLESQMNEDATLALELLQQQVRLAGFSNVNNSGARLFAGRAVLGCDGGFTNNAGSTAFEALACNTTTTGSDAIAVRYEATLLNSQSVTSSGVQLPANCVNEGIATWNALAEGASSATPLALADNRYYVANDADGTPSLFCQGRTGAGFGTATALIPNIENMQVQYAVTALPTAGNPIPHHVAGYVSASNTALGATAGNWPRVAALRVCLLARSATAVPTGDNSVNDVGRYLDCDGVEQTATDRRLRRAYITTIQLRNMRPALPADYVSGQDPWAYLYE
ncbi:PilW family protein [Hydrogenophaga sp. MI9]|uniref:PilW family protein n=1 Tax=Hydrogenophaga sp. MI9 TaxID=3453719 RepID=UPI003EEE5F03